MLTGKEKGVAGRIDIYNSQGRHIRNLGIGEGVSKVVWDGTNWRGKKLASKSIIFAYYKRGPTSFAMKLVVQ